MNTASRGSGGRTAAAAILTLYFFSLGYSVVTPAMSVFAEAFPDREYALINSLPTLFIGIAGLILGPVAGKYMRFHTLAVLGSALALFAGLGPAFTQDFDLILVFRALHGFGIGLIIAMANTLANGRYDGERRTKMLAVGSILLNAGGICVQTLGGFLAETGWQTVFYGHVLFAAALVMSFFIPEIETDTAAGTRPDRKLWIVAVLFATYGMMQFSVMQNTAELFTLRGAGGSSVSGLTLSVFTLAGCIGGLLFGTVKKKSPASVFPLLWILSFIGLAVTAYFESAAGMTAGMFVFGLGFGMVIPSFIDWTGSVCKASALAAGTAAVTASLYFGDFLSMVWKSVLDALFGEYMVSNLWVFSVLCLFLAFAFCRFPVCRTSAEE